MRAGLRGILAAAAGLAAAACVTPAEFYELERDVAALKRGEAGGAGGRVAELGVQVEDLEREVARLRGEVEETRHVADLALTTAKERGREVSSGSATQESRTPESSPAALEVGEYEEAFRLYRGTEYRSSIDRFQGFLQAYPTSDYADNALFWIGECWFKLEDFERAVLTFDEVAKKYPEGNKVPDAHYRQGIALIEIGERTKQESTYNAAAREIFRKIVNQYPNSERVPEAKRQLEKLGS